MASDNAEIKYFCDILHDRADKAIEKYGCGTAVYDYHEILRHRGTVLLSFRLISQT